MSKRRRKGSSPNLPLDTLERARQQARLDEQAEDAELDAVEAVEEEEAQAVERAPAPKVSTPKVSTARERRREERRRAGGSSGEQMQFSRRRRGDAPSAEAISSALRNPTKIVTEDELRQEYGYVLRDLRDMGLLSAALIVALVVIAQFI